MLAEHQTGSERGAQEASQEDARVLASQDRPHFIQSAAWAKVKEEFGWSSELVELPLANGRSLVVRTYRRSVPGLGQLIHVPRVNGIAVGDVPVLSAAFRKMEKSFGVKLELFQPDDDELAAALASEGWQTARGTQYRHAVEIDLAGTPDDIWARLKKRTRNLVRRASEQDIVVERLEADESAKRRMLDLVAVTKGRSGAYFHSERYLRATWNELCAAGQGRFYCVREEGDVVASAFVATFGDRAWYKDGGSVRTGSKSNAPHLLHVRIAEELQRDGFRSYELGNIPDPNGPQDGPMSGLGTFKRGFSKETLSFMETVELPITGRYRAWHVVEPLVGRVTLVKSREQWY